MLLNKHRMNKEDLRIVFMGTPEFAVESLKILVENNYNIVGVITVADKQAGRGRKIRQSPMKVYALEQGLKLLQPEKLKSPEFLNELQELKADLQIVVAFRMLPEVVWNMPRYGTFNLHASLLPQYRGAAPINRVIMNGENYTGVTTFFLNHDIDTGKIIFQKKVEILPDDDAGILHDRLMIEGAAMVQKTVDAIMKGDYPQISQAELVKENEELKLAPKIFTDDCRIDWSLGVDMVYNHIRGLSPFPVAWTNLVNENGKSIQMKIFKAARESAKHEYAAGKILTDGKTFLKVAVPNAYISLLIVQLSGKKRLPVSDFLRGFQQIVDYRFE